MFAIFCFVWHGGVECNNLLMAQFQNPGVPASTEPELQCSSGAPDPQPEPQPQPQKASEPTADAPLPQTAWNRLMHCPHCFPCRAYLRVWASCPGHLQIGTRRHICNIPRFERRSWSQAELSIIFRAMAHNNHNWEIAQSDLINWRNNVAQAKAKEESEKKRQKKEKNMTDAR